MGDKVTSKKKYIPVTDWNIYHSWPKVSDLRNLIFYKNSNGFDEVVKMEEKRVLIDEYAFFKWSGKQDEEE